MQNTLLVGASSGIGYATARLLAQKGHHVISIARGGLPADLQDTCKHFQLDVTKEAERLSEIDFPDALDGLVYLPGTITLKPFNRLTAEDFLNDFQINVLGAVNVIQAVLPNLKKSRKASVVLFSTVAVKLGMPFHASIAAAKAAIEGLVKSLAAEYATASIRFNAIAPSVTDTPLAARLLKNEAQKQNLAARHPLNGIGSADEIAHLVAYLLSPYSIWMTGTVLAYDGGLSTIKNS